MFVIQLSQFSVVRFVLIHQQLNVGCPFSFILSLLTTVIIIIIITIADISAVIIVIIILLSIIVFVLDVFVSNLFLVNNHKCDRI